MPALDVPVPDGRRVRLTRLFVYAHAHAPAARGGGLNREPLTATNPLPTDATSGRECPGPQAERKRPARAPRARREERGAGAGGASGKRRGHAARGGGAGNAATLPQTGTSGIFAEGFKGRGQERFDTVATCRLNSLGGTVYLAWDDGFLSPDDEPHPHIYGHRGDGGSFEEGPEFDDASDAVRRLRPRRCRPSGR